MAVLIGTTGKRVIIDDPKQTQELLNIGFRMATQQEADEFIKERISKFEAMQKPLGDKTAVHFFTVSQGGKDGYGVASMHLQKELTKLGFQVGFNNENQKVALVFHAPQSIAGATAQYRILYTMFESTRIPDEWIPYLEAADLVIVPSKWCADVFKQSGINCKVVPLGYDDQTFVYKERQVKDLTKENFTFLHYNAFNVRKGFTELFRAFVQEFRHDEPVRLILKTNLDELPLPITKTQYPNIEIVRGKASAHDLAELCYRSDCFVFPSRGEGFGMTPLEAMATGIPAIVPNAHGISEYFNDEYMYEVKVKEECPALYSRYKNQDVGKMVICDVDHLASQMRYAYEHQKETIAMGRNAAEYVKKYNYAQTAAMIAPVLKEYLEKPPRQNNDFDVLPITKIT